MARRREDGVRVWMRAGGSVAELKSWLVQEMS